jgi:hypothetical protein
MTKKILIIIYLLVLCGCSNEQKHSSKFHFQQHDYQKIYSELLCNIENGEFDIFCGGIDLKILDHGIDVKNKRAYINCYHASIKESCTRQHHLLTIEEIEENKTEITTYY